MNILLDILILAILILCIVHGFHKTAIGSVSTLLVAAVSLVAAWFLSAPASQLTVKLVEGPIASEAAGDIAQMAGVPSLDNGYDTMTGIDPDTIFTGDPEGLSLIAEKYRVEVDTLRQAYQDAQARNSSSAESSQAVLSALISPAAFAIARSITYLLLYAVIYLILRAVCRRVFAAQLKSPHTKKTSPVAVILGAATGFLLVAFLFTGVIGLVRPYEIGVLSTMQLADACEKSVFYGFFSSMNLFL